MICCVLETSKFQTQCDACILGLVVSCAASPMIYIGVYRDPIFGVNMMNIDSELLFCRIVCT